MRFRLPGLAAVLVLAILPFRPAWSQIPAAPHQVGTEVLVALQRMSTWAAQLAGVPGPDPGFLERERERLAIEMPRSSRSSVTAILAAPRTLPGLLNVYARSAPVFQQGLIASIRSIYRKATPPFGASAVAENLAGLAEEWSRTGGPPASMRQMNDIVSQYRRPNGFATGGSVLPHSMEPGCMNPMQAPQDRNSSSYCSGFSGVPNINGGVNGR